MELRAGYGMVVVQPTNYCNANCSYCYLPGRRNTATMPPGIAERVAADILRQGHEVEVIWHSGEPTAIGVPAMRRLLAPFAEARTKGLVRHAIQTNATLVDDGWCELLGEYGFSIGVSLDGPVQLASARVDWAGHQITGRALRGVRRLRAYGLNPYAICVVPPQNTGRGYELMRFFHENGFDSVAFNLEGREGVNTVREQPTNEQARRFWTGVITYGREHIGAEDVPVVRELLAVQAYVDGETWEREPMPTVMRDGSVVLASPELAGLKSARYHDFVAGHLLTESLSDIVARAPRVPYVAEYHQGLAKCAATCSFWQMCGGGYACNRWAEHGRFDTARTDWCTGSRIELARALIDLLDGDTTSPQARALSKLDPERAGGKKHGVVGRGRQSSAVGP
ncbi:radical SAM protein [Streptomyces gamaensis]|uniref:Radical SAM protein n=1 Tax=Streptomyces gamaensis TaxID=1763542 RepID=A0ABW0Z3I1_9ACTN